MTDNNDHRDQPDAPAENTSAEDAAVAEFTAYATELYRKVMATFRQRAEQAQRHAEWQGRLSQLAQEYATRATQAGSTKDEIRLGLLIEVARALEPALEPSGENRPQWFLTWPLSDIVN